MLILHMKKIMNSIIETVENKIKPKPQLINEKISKFFNLKKKKIELNKDRLIYIEIWTDGFSRIQFHV